jgi:hypothetical protein
MGERPRDATSLRKRAALITVDFGGHGAIGHQQCVTTTALAFLINNARQLPDDQICPACESPGRFLRSG